MRATVIDRRFGVLALERRPLAVAIFWLLAIRP